MFGLEILDVVIGLMFVYLLLALLTSALNEYVSTLLNLRGKELARGLGRLLDDVDEHQGLKRAFDGVGTKLTTATDSLTEQFYNHRLIRPLATRRGWFFRMFIDEPRLPSYIPARTFALALLDLLGVADKDAGVGALVTVPAGKTIAQVVAQAEQTAATAEAAAERTKTPDDVAAAREARLAASRAQLAHVLEILKKESPIELSEHLKTLETLAANSPLGAGLQTQVAGLLTGTQTQLQKLHDGVEVWFNNAMDRVSGAYKRNVQGWLFVLGLLITAVLNADTLSMWRQLAANDELRSAMVQRATATLPSVDTLVNRPAGDSLTLDQARARYQAASRLVGETDLQLGWSRAPGMGWPAGFWPGVLKIVGLLLTALAISLGAPFWFDLLNKVISIRATGRSPEEDPKSPQGAAKRAAEDTPK